MTAPVGGRGEVLAPFCEPGFRATLAAVHAHARLESQRLAAEARLLDRLARQVPRATGDERGASAWTSFLREVAVARRCSDRGASSAVALACRLVELPRTLALLESGDLPVLQARALVDQTWGCSPATLIAIDDEVAERACRLSPSRVRQAVDKVVLRLEADLVAVRAAAATATRHARRSARADDQAEIVLIGPAVPLAQAWQALDHDARALRSAGDPRCLDALRFDLAVDRLLADHARPAVPGPDGASAPDAAATGRGAAVGTDPGASAAPVGGPAADASEEVPRPALPAAPGPRGPQAPLTDDRDSKPDAPAASSPLPIPQAVAAPPPAPPPATPPDAGSPGWSCDRRFSRPVRLDITVPVTTALGLSQEPGWLPGHGWISAPTVRQLSVNAELRRLCLDQESGVLVGVESRPVRPELTPEFVAAALRDMAIRPHDLEDVGWREEQQHDPSDALREFVQLRDGACDGPTQAQVLPRRADLDHAVPYPDGPTAAWNLTVRSERTHLLKHAGWTPLRTPDSTVWFSPAGQVVEVPLRHEPLRDLDDDARLPDPVELHAFEAELLRPPTDDDRRPHPPRPGRGAGEPQVAVVAVSHGAGPDSAAAVDVEPDW